MTKEETKEYNKRYYQANKEKKAAYDKANKEKIDAYNKVWREANRERIAATNKAWYEDTKDGLYTVYYLKEEHYAGMTSTSLNQRFYNHKSHYNRHTEDVEIIGRYETKQEALRVEAALHAMGYLGRHQNYKQQTLKELL